MITETNWPSTVARTDNLLDTHTHTHPLNGPFSGTTRVDQYQKGKTNLHFTEARDSEWQWHQLGHMQVCTSLQTDSHASTPPLSFYRPDALPAAQPTASKHWRHLVDRQWTSMLSKPSWQCIWWRSICRRKLSPDLWTDVQRDLPLFL